jgi:hypothetical protein
MTICCSSCQSQNCQEQCFVSKTCHGARCGSGGKALVETIYI